MKKNILLILPASGFSIEEFQIIKNNFEKNGYCIFISSDTNMLCIGDNGTRVKSDVSIYNIHTSNFSAVVFIGGNGIRAYWDNKSYQNIAENFSRENKIISAICAAPVIFAKAGLLTDRNATCFLSDSSELENFGVNYLDHGVVVDDNIVTGQSASDSEHFAQIIMRKIEDGKY